MKDSSPRYYELILNQIREMIVSGKLKAGDRLPSERDLAEQYNVSRVPVREAIKILEYIGILEICTDGTYVRNIKIEDIITKMNFSFTATSKALNDLMELRCELECIAAKFAAQRHTSNDIAAMEKVIRDLHVMEKDFQNLSPEGIQNLHDLSHHFHELVVQATQNQIFIQIYHNLYELLDISMQYTGVSENSSKAYENILLCLVNHDSEGASEHMRAHLNRARKKILQYTLSNELAPN